METELKRSIKRLDDLCAAAAEERQPQRPRLDTASPTGFDGDQFATKSLMDPVKNPASKRFEHSSRRLLSWTGFMAAAHAGEQRLPATIGNNMSPQTQDRESEQSYLIGYTVLQSSYREMHWNPRSIFVGHTLDSFMQELPLSFRTDASGFELHLSGPDINTFLFVGMDDADKFESFKDFINTCFCSTTSCEGDPKYILVIKERCWEDDYNDACQPLHTPDSQQRLAEVSSQRFVSNVQPQQPQHSQSQEDMPGSELWPELDFDARQPLPQGI